MEICYSTLVSVALGLVHGPEPYSRLVSRFVSRWKGFLHVNKTDRRTFDSLTLAPQVGFLIINF